MTLFPTPHSAIKVLLVDDSPIALAILKKILATAPGIQVVGTAANGKEGLVLIPRVQPDVICTDLHMPVMDGLELTKAVMAQYPRPILVLSVSVQKEQTHNVFKLIDAGAIDVMAKPLGGLEEDGKLNAQELITKIKILSGVVVIQRRRDRRPATPAPDNVLPLIEAAPLRIIGIGASTGGPQALQAILAQLPASLPVPVLCVQHISEGFMQGLVEWLAGQCQIRIRSAETGVTPQPGTVYFPRDNTHLKIDNDGRLLCVSEPLYGGHRPSISVTFTSLARHYSNAAAAVLLTGMGRDGVDGLHAIAQAGGVTIAQDEESSVVFGMPKLAFEEGAARYVLPLHKIAPALISIANGQDCG